MTPRGYTVLGWVVWQFASRMAKRSIRQNRSKLVAAATVVLVLVAGLAAAKATGGDES